MDYAHPLRFGVLLDPDPREVKRAVELAQRAERLGLELVAVSGEPLAGNGSSRGPSHDELVDRGPAGGDPGDGGAILDPWTLLTWVAGATERVTVAVTDLELPPVPAVLARAAASLDLLAGGRLELGLAPIGTPAVLDATGLDSTSTDTAALAEGIEILRTVWSASGEPIHFDGEVFAMHGAQRGPGPAHNVAVWLSSSAPADDQGFAGPEHLLHLAGAVADGWHGTLGSADVADLVAVSSVIDDAARAAGRDPREVRRSLTVPPPNVPPAQWASELARLAIEHGISTFVLDAADDGVLGTLANDAAPAVRAEVAEARRAAGAVVGVPLPARLALLRRPGIDYAAVPASVPSVEPWHAQFSAVRSNYLRGGDPGLVLLPRDAGEVGEAIKFARAQQVPLGVRSGGHGVSGRSTNDGGVVIDLSRLNSIEVLDPGSRLVRVGAGAKWSEVAAALAPFELAVTSGDSGGVGVGGLASAGGIGWYARKHGLTIDRVRAVDVVLADGTPLRTSATEHPDLFWGMRGAVGNLAIATSFEIEAHPGGPLGFAQLVFDASDVAGFLERWGGVVEAASRDVTSFLLMGRPQPGQPVIAQVMVAVDAADPDTVIGHLQPFAPLAPLLDQSVRITPYGSVIVPPFGPHRGEGEPVTRSSLVKHISRDVARAAERVVVGGASYFFQIRAVGGAVSDVAPDATAYAHRGANFSLISFGASRARLDPVWDELHRHAEGLYLSFETDPRPERLTDAFPPATLARLREVKSKYDPDGVLRDNFPIGMGSLG